MLNELIGRNNAISQISNTKLIYSFQVNNVLQAKKEKKKGKQFRLETQWLIKLAHRSVERELETVV